MEARIAIVVPDGPEAAADPEAERVRAALAEAVARGGGAVVPPGAANGLVWLVPARPELLGETLDAHPGIRWVQFPWAGVEKYAEAGAFRDEVTFTCAKGAYAGQVSEHALLLTLASLRNIARQARTPRWLPMPPTSLSGRTVTILGGGGIAGKLVRLLQPFGCHITVIRRRPDKLDGADDTLPPSALHATLPGTDVLVLALALTPGTRHVIGRPELELLPPHAVIVNVARGAHIDTDALVEALREDRLAAAGLDVTDPEPLPGGHPLWDDPRVLITSHCADSPEYVTRMLCERVERNVRHLRDAHPLEGVIDPTAGY
ncbi:D-isomer specific 2-hydroxyacid dehydrogenase family protein [Sphaerisporangium album]|uniref:D-isomer specific 2-hydroxyacid dehydrogenase family protein n=1 Tax=Sphaerisporangium album TaxID=509200 RepID=UPI0011C0336D|nr:D-isomer specific 2-hydroxyacid dehydrogenase family protein [Sphaerisporangium album]